MSYRSDILDYLKANWSDTSIIELDEYMSFDDLPAQTVEEIVLMVDFPVSTERMVTIAVHQANGYRQDGTCQFLFANPVGISNAEVIVLGEKLQALFRGKRLGDTVIMTINPFTAQFVDGKWQVWSSQMTFYRDLFQ